MSQVLQKLREAARTRWAEMVRETPPRDGAHHPARPHTAPPPADRDLLSGVRLVPIASGKGGVGKTNVAVNLSITAGLSFHGTEKRVLLIDGDLGLPNTDLVLGVRPETSLNDLVDRTIDDMARLVCRTRYPQLDFIAGAEEATLLLGNLYYQQRRSIMSQISRLQASLVVFDLGASASKEILDFFAMTPSGLVVLNPEPSSVRDAYVFIKNALIRRARQEMEYDAEARQEFDRRLEETHGNFQKLTAGIAEGAPAALRSTWEKTLETFRPLIVVNRVDSLSEGLQTARKFVKDADKLLGIKILYLGSVLRDDAVTRAVKRQCPFRIAEPTCPASRCIDAVTKNLLTNDSLDLNGNFVSFGRILASRLVGRPV